MANKAILYLEDEPTISRIYSEMFRNSFPDYDLVTDDGSSTAEQIIEKTRGIEGIASICSDGKLKRRVMGWDIVEALRNQGYRGPAIYCGSTDLPPEKSHLFTHNLSSIVGADMEEVEETMRKSLTQTP